MAQKGSRTVERAEFSINRTKLSLVQGDITGQDTEAIVNAANSTLMGGGGVDGAIHRAGGPKILEECRRIVAGIGSLPTGEAVITTGGDLKAKYVVHTVGPVWQNGWRNEDVLLHNAYVNSLKCAREHNVRTISFPSISTGAYRYPVRQAANIAVSAIIDFLRRDPSFTEVRLVLWSREDFDTYREAVEFMLI